MSWSKGLPSCLHCTGHEVSGSAGLTPCAHPLCSLQQESVILPNDNLDRHCDALIWEGAGKAHGTHAQQRPLVPVVGAHGPQIPVSFLLYSCTAVRKGTTAGADTETSHAQRQVPAPALHYADCRSLWTPSQLALCLQHSIKLPALQMQCCLRLNSNEESAGRASASAGDLFLSMRDVPAATWAACF